MVAYLREATIDMMSYELHFRPICFQRFRTKRVKHQPDRQGSFWRLAFDKPVQGPLALGFTCHFGLGMFRPMSPVDTLAHMPDVGRDMDFER